MSMSLRIDETVGYHIKELRLERNLTQQALAMQAGVSKQTISNLEKGRGAKSSTLEGLAKCLGVSPFAVFQEIQEDQEFLFRRRRESNVHNKNDNHGNNAEISKDVTEDTYEFTQKSVEEEKEEAINLKSELLKQRLKRVAF